MLPGLTCATPLEGDAQRALVGSDANRIHKEKRAPRARLDVAGLWSSLAGVWCEDRLFGQFIVLNVQFLVCVTPL